MSKHDCQTIRELGYKSCIPYYILFDPDLNQNHLKLYTLIEQMESNPNPNVKPTFSYAWFASLIGIKERGAMKIAKRMKDKGYLVHIQQPNGRWIWGTTKKPIIEDNDENPSSQSTGVSSQDTGGVSSQDTGGVSSQDTLNTKKINYHKEENTKLVSSSFIFSKAIDSKLLAQKLDRDLRSDEEFLSECVEHVNNHSNKSYPQLQRANALVKLLANLNNDNVIFRPKEQDEPHQEQNKVVALYTADELQLMQEYQHALKMQNWGNDINVFMKESQRIKAMELLERKKLGKDSQLCTQSSNARKNCSNSASSLVSALTLSQQDS